MGPVKNAEMWNLFDSVIGHIYSHFMESRITRSPGEVLTTALTFVCKTVPERLTGKMTVNLRPLFTPSTCMSCLP
jgi:hypothetical protein